METFSYHFLVCFSIRRSSSNTLHSYHFLRRLRQITDARMAAYLETRHLSRFCYDRHLLCFRKPIPVDTEEMGNADGQVLVRYAQPYRKHGYG
jgi:hypothetical protein